MLRFWIHLFLVVAVGIASGPSWAGVDAEPRHTGKDRRTDIAVRAAGASHAIAVRTKDAGPRVIPSLEAASAQRLPPIAVSRIEPGPRASARLEDIGGPPLAARAPPPA